MIRKGVISLCVSAALALVLFSLDLAGVARFGPTGPNGIFLGLVVGVSLTAAGGIVFIIVGVWFRAIDKVRARGR